MSVLHCKTKGALVAAAIGANVTTLLTTDITKVKIWTNTPIQVVCAFMYLVARRRSVSHYKSATQFAPQGGQWPTSVTHFAKVTYLRPPTRLFHSPTLRRLVFWCDRSKSPRGRDVEQSSPRPDWIQNRQAHPGGRSQKLPPEAEQSDFQRKVFDNESNIIIKTQL